MVTETQIIKRLCQKDEEALVYLRCEYERYCYSIAYSILRDEESAMECINEVYMSIWSSEDEPANLKAYLAKVTRNTALQYLRKQSAKKRSGTLILFDELAECLADPNSDREIEDYLLRDVLNEFVRSLPPEERYVFIQRYWYGFNIEEIAIELSWHSAKVKSMLFRTRKKLKKCLAKEGYAV